MIDTFFLEIEYLGYLIIDVIIVLIFLMICKI